jgi:hypothetical protein
MVGLTTGASDDSADAASRSSRDDGDDHDYRTPARDGSVRGGANRLPQGGDSDGDAIREAIKDFQVARAGLKRADAVAAARSAPAHLAAAPAPREESIGDSLEEIGASALSFFRRATRGLLQAG